MQKELWKPGNMLYPLPAVMVSCGRLGETPNIITVAWTGTVCTNPPMVYISVKPERYSYEIIRETGEFVLNLSTRSLAKAADYCGVKSGREVNKFKEMKLTPIQGTHVNAPLIGESPVSIECKLTQRIELGSHHMFLGEVLGVHVNPEFLNNKGKFELSKADPIVYSHGEYFCLGDILGSFGYSVKKQDKQKY